MIGKIVKYAACSAFALTLACGTLFAQEIAHAAPSSAINTPSDPRPLTTVKLFSNLGPTPTNNYNDTTGFYFLGSANTVALSEQWDAVPFTPAQASHVTSVAAAIGVLTAATDGHFNLCIYSDNAGVVGTPLTGCPAATVANANATAVFGTCCALTTVHFAGAGLALTAHTQYWVVATTVDATHSTVTAVWSASNLAFQGFNVAQGGWFTQSDNAMAVSVSGTIP
jgi:hypothetical protein